MPVVSQSRFSTTSSTSLSNSLSTGSYRSTHNNSDRPYYSSTSGSYVSPRRIGYTSNSVSEYRTHSYDGDGIRERKSSYSSDYNRYSRAPSVAESDSAISCDSRLNSRPDRSGSRSRDVSMARSDSARSSRSDPPPRALSSGLSSSELYKKYSPNFYVPQAQRLSSAVTGLNGEASSRAKLSGDAARLPLPRRSTARQADDEVKPKHNTASRPAIKRHTNSTLVAKPCAPPPECATNTDRVTNEGVKRDIECAQRQRSLRGGEALSGSRSSSVLSACPVTRPLPGLPVLPAARAHWGDRKPSHLLLNGYHDATDNNGNDLQLSVAEIRRKFDSKMASMARAVKNPSGLHKTALSSDNIYSQLRNHGSISSLNDDKPVPVHKPMSTDKYVNGATGSLRWDFLSPSSGYSSDSKGSESSYSIKQTTEPGCDISTIYISGGKVNADRLPINAVKNQLNANNAMGRILEKSTTVYVGNGDAQNQSSSVSAKQEKSNEPKNILNIEIGNSSIPNGKTNEKSDDESVLKKIPSNHTSDFASYIQVSTPISSSVQSNVELPSKETTGTTIHSPKYNGEYSAKTIGCLLSTDEFDGTKLRYIDSDPNSENDTRLFIEYKDDTVDGEQGFENKTFEHENGHLLRKPSDESNMKDTVKTTNGTDEVDYSYTKIKLRNGDSEDKHYKVPTKHQNGYAKLTNGVPAEEESEKEHYTVDKAKKDDGLSAEPSHSKQQQEVNGESSALYQQYTNDSRVSRGASPLSGAGPQSTCGTLNSLSQRKSCTAPEQLSKTSGLNGLRNIGNTCFMNSVVQCLSNTRPLMEYTGNPDQFNPDINTTLSCMKGALIKAFSTVISELWREGECDGVVNTTALKAQIQRFAPRFMGYSQQDAQEFLRYLLEGLHEDVNRVTIKPKPILTEIDDNLSDAQKAQESWNRYLRMEDSRVGDIFVGQLKSSLRCTHCNHTSVTFDPFWDLSLPIPSRTGPLKLTQCLSHFTKEEELDGDEKPTCSKCQVRRKCLKWFTIQKFPRVLVLHLKRFSPQERFRGKLNVLVEFPLQGLDLGSCAASSSRPHQYNLYAVSNHSGTTYSGHYTAYCKHPYNSEWHEYNDSRVSPITPKNVVSSEAYVLFYEMSEGSSSS